MALIDSFGSSEVTVKKEELLASVRANKQKHVSEFKELRIAFENAFRKEADKLLRQANEGNFSIRAITLPEPVNHEQDYNVAIRMLEMSTAKEIKISESQFRQLVMDEWKWKSSFDSVKTAYVGAIK